MAKKITYSEKLKNPKWQKKRLEILQRDNFKCQHCMDYDKTLNVHHISYSECDPWDIKSELLITLCESCHEHETKAIKEAAYQLIMQLKDKGFQSCHFYQLSDYLFDMERKNILEVLGKC